MTAIPQLTPREFMNELTESDDMFVLDLRNEEEFEQWPLVSHGSVETLNIPYFHFLEDEDASVAKLPKDRTLTLICAKGGASDYLGSMLADKGYQVRHLAGGTLALSELHEERIAKSEERDGLLLIQFDRVAKGCLSYMIGSNGEGLVIDAGRDIQMYMDAARRHNVEIRGVIDTHLHADHISGGRALAEELAVPYYLPPADAGQVVFPYTPYTHGTTLLIGKTKVTAIGLSTPGHTAGSMSVLVDDKYLLTGDTLFVYSVGRPDLGGMADTLVYELHETLLNRYGALADDVEIYPAHYTDSKEQNDAGIYTTTLGESRQTNLALKLTDPEEFAAFILGDMPETPPNFQQIRQINMGRVRVSDAEATELEVGPNRCAANKLN